MKATTISNFRANLKSYLDMVEDSSMTLSIPRQGSDQEGVVIMGMKDYSSLMETLHLMSSPKNHRHLLEGIEQVDRGEVVTKSLKELEEL